MHVYSTLNTVYTSYDIDILHTYVHVHRSKLSHLEHRKLLKDFCVAFSSEVDKSHSTTTMEEAAM